MNLKRVIAGLRPYTPDGLPIVGVVAPLDGFFMAAGHEGDGIALSPTTGEIIAGLMVDNKTYYPIEEYKLGRFDPNRAEILDKSVRCLLSVVLGGKDSFQNHRRYNHMTQTLNFAVLGSGNGGRAFCGQIAYKGYPVVMYEPLAETADYLKLKEEKRMSLSGDISVGGKLRGVTMDIKEALRDANVIFIVVPSFAHSPIFQKMIPHLKDGQHVIIVPGNYGGFLLKKMMSDAGIHPDISISETASLPYACRISDYDTVMIYKKKFKLKIATSPAETSQTVLDVMNDVFSGFINFISGSNLLAIDLDNINYTLHPLPVLLNYGGIEKKPETFRHYTDGLTPLISEQMMKMDGERMAIGTALELDLMSTLDQLMMYYGHNESTTYYEYVNSDESPYKDIVGHNVRSRYITEDVPFLHVPAIELAHLVGIDVPIAELCVKLSSLLHGVDYVAEGTTLEKLGLGGKTVAEIVAIG